ncbi:MAG: long-chain fatty acid--CoA ligase [Bacillota bacterium]|nr:long-chain fatty acid--CoA ligase [Bacillota bacterium]MDW7729862.1 long-chain fatty acid--CoA ligase [Bacillota bacterium]
MSERIWLKNYPVQWNLTYPETSLYRYMRDNTARHDDLIAMMFSGEKISFKMMHLKIDSFAAALLDLGVQKGDRVALIMPNCPEYVYAYYACMKIGAIEVQIDPLCMPSEVELAVKDSDAKVIIVADLVIDSFQAVRDRLDIEHVIVNRLNGKIQSEDEDLWFDELLEKYPPASPEAEISPKDDIAVLQYTSGTTGSFKAAMLTHHNIICNVVQKREWFSDWFKEKFNNGIAQYYGLAIMPFFHATGMTAVMNFGLNVPFGLLLTLNFNVDDTLDLIDKYRPVFFMGVPTIFTSIANHPDAEKHDLKSVDIWRTGGAPMPVDVIERFEARNGLKIIEGYGLTEASPTTHANPFRGIRKFGSIGLPFPDTDCRIVDLESGTKDLPVGMEGELIVRGPQVMKGYWKRPAETAETLRDGWLYTGDIAKMDSGGFFYIVGRKKDMIITGGLNVFPGEVDEVLSHHPKVIEVLSTGIPDEYYGEAIKTYVVKKNGETVTEEELLDYCSKRLAVYKLPRIIEFRNELPKSNVGKLLRRILVEEEKSRRTGNVDVGSIDYNDWEEEVFTVEDFMEDFDS